MQKNLDFELDYEIQEESLYQFELTDSLLLIYNETQNIWYIQTEEDVNEPIFVVEDEADDIFYIEEVSVFDYIMTIVDFAYFKELVQLDNNE